MAFIDQNIKAPRVERIPSGIDCFLSSADVRVDPSFIHVHDCIEMVYIPSGSATHVLEYPDGKKESQQLNKGDYFIIDYRVGHYYRDCTKGFYMINFLWHPTFLRMSGNTEKSFYAILQNAPFYLDRSMLMSPPVNRVFHDTDHSIGPLFESALKCYREQSYGYYELLRCYCTQILLLSLKHVITGHPVIQKSRVISEICDYIAVNYAEHVTLTGICRQKNYSISYISQKFKSTCGITFEQYLSNVRIQKACELLLQSDDPIAEIAFAVGYNTPIRFRGIFHKTIGMLPSAYRKTYKMHNKNGL